MNVTKEELKSIQVGAVIEFAEIDWRVLQKTADAVLVISEKVLAVKPYNTEWEDITWEKCTLRKWLNEDFYSIFTDDKIFLLSIDEAEKLFANDTSRAVGSWWWLRSPGDDQDGAAYVYGGGSLDVDGEYVYCDYGVRPALNLKF